jgi:hypothetical protein
MKIFNFLFNSRKKSVINNSIPQRFEKWEDCIKYLGKPVRVCFVEGPDVKGRLNGISLATNGDEILEVFLEVNGFFWEYWKCRPENNM